jgi:hypothetical protein
MFSQLWRQAPDLPWPPQASRYSCENIGFKGFKGQLCKSEKWHWVYWDSSMNLVHLVTHPIEVIEILREIKQTLWEFNQIPSEVKASRKSIKSLGKSMNY